MRRPTIALAALLATAAAGCGAAGDSTGDFSGAEQEVAQAVEDLEEAATEGEPRRVCTQLLAQATARRLGGGCTGAVQRAFDGADTYALAVESVRVTGDRARAQVATGRDQDTREAVELVRERGGWRIVTFGGA
jgi:hypothetical protein